MACVKALALAKGLLAESELDGQQQAANAHLGAERELAIVTGIVGVGKSRLQRDVAAA